ncbi:hypothetical protein JHK85_028727 [Glycine max]|nr:hypothetical protein JHK85_028727 [Glycine max]KAG5004047.1 hypothetical protein JHK86_028186 [Glycine max]
MVNVHDGLYFIDHFQPSLSALPSFSIAVVIIHTQSPTLEPNNAQEFGGSAGNKFRMSLGLPVAAVLNCADNTYR